MARPPANGDHASTGVVSSAKSHRATKSPSKYYFLKRGSSQNSNASGDSTSMLPSPSENGEEVIENIPEGSTVEEFSSRPVMDGIYTVEEEEDNIDPTPAFAPVGSLLLPRKVPVKVEPKVFFANERTFLTWMHSALWLYAASITILKYSTDPWSMVYGAILLPVAIAFSGYALYQHIRRARMIRVKHPGPYEDLRGPTVLGVTLMVAICVQFMLKLYTLWY